ncbi:MAG: acyl-CoA synthetase [Saprospiraceae bacterium]|nr:acyl-CoA synthetase [Saprospiraceae bacterium]
MISLIKKASQYLNNTAILSNGQSYTYQDLLAASAAFAAVLLDGAQDLNEKRVAFMVESSFDYVKTQWAIWRAGGVAVPLCITYPLASLQYVIEDTGADIIVVTPQYKAVLEQYALSKSLKFIVLEVSQSDKNLLSLSKKHLPNVTNDRRAMILYTSGTTNLPKGVVTTHRNLDAQIKSLIDAWAYSEHDRTICILPLHHVHGIMNVISCTLWAGGRVEFLSFHTEGVFANFLKGETNVFMAVPTIYFKLIAYFDTLTTDKQKELTATMQRFRLMVSGSAALPVSVMEKWENVSGHRLLERYGMTEIGMGISNPYAGERRAGHIGQPLKGVKTRLVDDNGKKVKAGEAGEIQIKGTTVFKEYWQKPQATEETFTTDAWFKTGDVAVVENGYYRILGRNSIDIIKSGGYKISALEIEEILRTHPNIADCSVVGIADEEWGELVAAVLVLNTDVNAHLTPDAIDLAALNAWIREKMPAYKTPRRYHIIQELPRNAMGKVTKNDLKTYFVG